MTVEQAIGKVHSCMHVDWDMMIEARDMAIEALEKQIPKKVYEGEIEEYVGFYCPECNNELPEDQEQNYCPECGQRLDWGRRHIDDDE